MVNLRLIARKALRFLGFVAVIFVASRLLVHWPFADVWLIVLLFVLGLLVEATLRIRARLRIARNNPTKDWQRPDRLLLEFNLDQASLNGIRIGEPLERLSFLGPSEDRSGVAHQIYRYFSLGLCLDCKDDHSIESISVLARDPQELRYRPYRGRFHYGNSDLSLAQLTEREFTRLAGSPYWRDEEDGEVTLFYEFPGLEWQVEFGSDGIFERISLITDPLLAGEVQRRNFGVSAPWPPTHWKQIDGCTAGG